MVHLQINTGVVVEKDVVFLSCFPKEYDYSTDFSRIVFLDRSSGAPKWYVHDLNWRTSSICVWRNGPYGERAYVALSTNGEVEIVGPKASPHIFEHIPGAGIGKPWSLGKGTMRRIRQIGGHLYACGPALLTFRRGANGWEDFSDPVLRDLPDWKPVPENELNSVESWLKFKPPEGYVEYFDINGFAENDLYAVGR